ncbi:dihydrodipicolinate synthase family protein [Plastorhodobacter daqingensis]|uniref:Dihydrodipicolinate synthase family protein n=1 Tax=Plastorhodobacter daqingensis TaxID=1387281 RepID=A0ABW2UPQ0_9RHOB
MTFAGLSAFPITPMTADGCVQADALGRVLERLRRPELTSVGLLGSTGTFAYLSRAERRRAVAVAVEVLGGSVPLMVGVGALRTDEASALARDAAEAGADALLLPAVSYTPLTQEEAYEHYRAVAAATDLPLCIYNNPGTTHFTFQIGLLQRLAELPRIAAVKMPLPATGTVAVDLATLRGTLPAGFAIGYSGDWGCADALLAGADTWYSVIGGLLPDIALRLAAAATVGDRAETQRLDASLAPLWALFRAHGSLRVIHVMAQQMGLSDGLLPLPLRPLGATIRDQIAAATEALAE